MCVMGLVKPGQEFTAEHIESIYHKGNNDGFGMGYVEGERNEQGKLIKPGRVKVVKSMGLSFELKELYNEQVKKGLPFIFHLRNATAGDKIIENCHPYKILDLDEGDPIDLWMFHNGTLRNAWIKKNMSDSWNFATTHLRGVLRERPSMLYEDGFRFFLASMIEGNKLIFLDNRERVSIINHHLGSYHAGSGVWLSTKESIQPYKPYAPASASTGTTHHHMGFGSGAGGRSGTQTPSGNATDDITGSSTHLLPSGPRMTWKQPDGSKWVIGNDGRSHFISPGVEVGGDGEDAGQVPLLKPGGKDGEYDEAFLNGLIEKAAPPTSPDDYEKLRKDLAALAQTDLHQYVQEFPVEAAYLLKYCAALWSDALPEFADLSVIDLVVYCLESPWPAAYAIVIGARMNIKEKAHEVN